MAEGILEGIRVVSMGSAWAGPYVGRVLSEFGAEVFRIAFPGRVQPEPGKPELLQLRRKKLLAEGMSEQDIEKLDKPRPHYGENYQINNNGIGLDLRSEKGKEVYKKLIRVTDIVIDGWSPRVMASLGLDYSVLKEIKPDIIYLSIPAMGMTGPEKDVRMWGTSIDLVSGLASTRGYLGGEPHRAASYIVDGINSAHMLTALFAALNYRTDTGKGQHIDVSQAECTTFTMGAAIMDYSMNKRIAQPTGNRHAIYAPHNVYRCKGNDMWVTIAVTSEDEWHCFCDAIGNPEWTKEPKFADMLSRWHNQEELDKFVESWTTKHDHYAVQQILQQAGVAAAAVVTLEELILYDPQAKNREIYTWITYHDGVADPIFRVPCVLPKSPSSLRRCAPSVGQHNDYLLREVLGMSTEKTAELVREKVIGVGPPSNDS